MAPPGILVGRAAAAGVSPPCRPRWAAGRRAAADGQGSRARSRQSSASATECFYNKAAKLKANSSAANLSASVVNPDPFGSGTFPRIRNDLFRIRIRQE